MKKTLFAVLCTLLAGLFLFVTACIPKEGGNGDEGEYTLAPEEGCNQLTIYYNRAEGYADCDAWLWWDGENGTGHAFHKCEYGGKVIVNVPEEVTEVGFIIRLNCANPGGSTWGSEIKDATDSDRKIKMIDKNTEIYLKAGDKNNYTSKDGGKTLELMRYISIADMQDLSHVKFVTSDGSSVSSADVKITTVENGKEKEVPIASVSNNTATMAAPLDITKPYTLNIRGMDPVGIVPLTYFNSADFENNFGYDGALGVELGEDNTVFRLWAPTASDVKLNLYDDGVFGKPEVINMTKGEKGVWTHTHKENLNGMYYTYSVTTSMGTQEAVDPYARSAGLNGKRGMIIDLDSTDPDDWDSTPFKNENVVNYTDAQIWEIHIRDFSNKITDSKLKTEYRGKYLGFTVDGLTNADGVPVGLAYLKELGITHVHLLPSYDFASVDESSNDEFNWGYDPDNYNVPEGSYSTDPSNGFTRVNEYKQMVQALHNAGIGVIMDVVYNHTFSSDSNLNKVVPYYYYRYNADGTPSNGSGCGNETASDRAMVRKYIVDSVKYWQSEYNLDGFRFDLMGVHDLTTMQEVEKAVHGVNSRALVYGEGWTGGTAALNEDEQAVLKNLQNLNKGTSTKGVNGVAMFNDVIRDGIKGSVFDINDTGFATGARADYIENVLFGVTGSAPFGTFTSYQGSWMAGNPTQVINYVSAHDNNTLWDRICHVYGEQSDTLSSRLAMNRLSAAIVQTSLGIPFMQAGEEMLRAKKNEDGTYNENSYNAPDSVNNLNWDALKKSGEQYKMMQYYKGLMAFRARESTLRQTVSYTRKLGSLCEIVKKEGAFVAFTMLNAETNKKLLIIYNAGKKDVEYTLPSGTWNLYIDGTRAGTSVLGTAQGGSKQTVSAVSCYVYKLA